MPFHSPFRYDLFNLSRSDHRSRIASFLPAHRSVNLLEPSSVCNGTEIESKLFFGFMTILLNFYFIPYQ
jgi:hypothetical protein